MKYKIYMIDRLSNLTDMVNIFIFA